jgi:hypothetical protein
MLLTREQLQHATALDAAGVNAALEMAGYSDNRITGARFEGMNDSRQFIYDIMFEDPDCATGIGLGRVFLQYFEQLAGIVLLGEF